MKLLFVISSTAVQTVKKSFELFRGACKSLGNGAKYNKRKTPEHFRFGICLKLARALVLRLR